MTSSIGRGVPEGSCLFTVSALSPHPACRQSMAMMQRAIAIGLKPFMLAFTNTPFYRFSYPANLDQIRPL
jgi:hypothetical protein